MHRHDTIDSPAPAVTPAETGGAGQTVVDDGRRPVYSADPITFVVPGPVRGKGRPRFVRATGRTYTPAATASYENLIRVLAMEAMQDRAPFDGAVCVRLDINVTVPASWSRRRRQEAMDGLSRPIGKPDMDNVLKLFSDALNGVVYLDDKQIVDVTVSRWWGSSPGAVVTVRPWAA